MKQKIIISLTLLVAGLVVYSLLLVDLHIVENDTESVVQNVCPTESNFSNLWNKWSYEYLTDNPGVDVNTQMNDWNALMIENNCDEQWLDPLADLIEQQAASATPVYWYIEQ